MEDNKAADPLREVEEGPYYRHESPKRTDIAGETANGEKLVITGRVLDTNGNPVEGAWLDFWQADETGKYDNTGYKLRGHQYSEQDGSFHLETVIPGPYGPRAPHVHVKIKISNTRVYTTQLFFPFSEKNEHDPIFEPANIMKLSDTAEGKLAEFDIIIENVESNS